MSTVAKAGVLALMIAMVPSLAVAEEDPSLLSRGEHHLTLSDVDGRITRFPEGERQTFVRNAQNFARMLDQLLMNRMLAAEARELGIADRPSVQKDIELAIEEVLAIHRMNELLDPRNFPEFDMLAQERYLANPGTWGVPARRLVQHVLIKTEARDHESALKLAQSVREQALQQPENFEELVARYSEDPGAAQNRGIYEVDAESQLVPEFVSGAEALTRIGEVGEPIESDFGFHVIKLLEYTPSVPQSWEQVRPHIIRDLQDEYRKEARANYIAELRALNPETSNPEVLSTLPVRYGGRPELESESGN